MFFSAQIAQEPLFPDLAVKHASHTDEAIARRDSLALTLDSSLLNAEARHVGGSTGVWKHVLSAVGGCACLCLLLEIPGESVCWREIVRREYSCICAGYMHACIVCVYLIMVHV